MSFLKLHHRKLLDKLEEDSDKICSPYCSSSNDSGACNPDCWFVCPEYCHSYLSPDTIISPPISSSSDDHHDPIIPNKFLIIIIALIVATFLALCCYVYYYKYYAPRRRRLLLSQQQRNETHDDFLDEDHGPVLDHPIWYIHTVGLHPAIINAIAVCKYKKGEGIVEGTDCSVCLSEFEEDETLRLLPKCNHAFHISCIDTWLRSHTNCPMCRAPIVKNPSFAASSAASSSSSELSSNNLSTNGDTQVIDLQVNGVNGENERDVGHGVHERIITATDEEDDVEIEYRMKINESGDEDADGELQPMRRSVSFDSVSAPKINQSTANTEIQEDIVGSSECQSVSEVDSRLGVVPKRVMPVSNMIRSFSCSGKFLLSKRSW